jgi:hypothetical protein
MPDHAEIDVPTVDPDEREQRLRWLRFLRGAINHSTNVEWRWIDGRMLGNEVSKSHAGHADATRELLDGTTGE